MVYLDNLVVVKYLKYKFIINNENIFTFNNRILVGQERHGLLGRVDKKGGTFYFLKACVCLMWDVYETRKTKLWRSEHPDLDPFNLHKRANTKLYSNWQQSLEGSAC